MTIKIEGQEFEAFEGETILEVARRNNIQIPTICYLSGCSPTLACKMCMVEVGGKRVYSCNAKIKEGMNVIVHSEEIQKDRKEIMTTYCVNHPLECGVCDKSGECELQDFTLYTQVDTQQFGLQESDKKPYSFAQSFYDPALCIMCERCVTTCKDNIGETNLKAGKATLFTPDNYKDTMGKDPYSVWAKRQKGLIEFVGKYECKDCGECISVCPVGAMTYKDFTYTSNAWELKKVYSTCGFCSSGCGLIYNVKHLDSKGDLQKVYRVQNDYLYNPICGVGRFAFDAVSIGTRNLTSVLQAFKRADSIFLGSDVSNEEALIAHLIAKKLGVPLINREARLYQIFQSHFIQASRFYQDSLSESTNDDAHSQAGVRATMFATFSDIATSSTLIALHAYFKYDAPLLRYKINNNLKMLKNTQLLSIGLFQDSLLQSLGKNVIQMNAKPKYVSVAGILGLVFANDLIDDFELCFPFALQSFLKSTESQQDSHTSMESDTTQDTPTDTQSIQDSTERSEDLTQHSADNLSPYNILPLLEALHIESLDSLKLAKKGGVLIISRHTIEEFIASDLQYAYGYGIALHHNDKTNPPSIAQAVSATIAEDIIKPVANVLMDTQTKIQIFAHLLAFLSQKLELKILYIPKGANIMGIANLCELSNEESLESQCSIGIRSKGDFVLDSNLDTIKPHFPLPTLAQSEGSITNMEGRVLPLHPSIPYLDSNLASAFDLSDIARELMVFHNSELEDAEYMGDFTKFLAKYSRGNFMYQELGYQDLQAHFERDGRDNRGYSLLLRTAGDSQILYEGNKKHAIDLKFSLRLDSIQQAEFHLANHNADNQNSEHACSLQSKQNDLMPLGFHAVKLETQNHFNLTTLASKNLQSKSGIYTSEKMLAALNLKNGDGVVVRNQLGEIHAHIYCDYDLEDSILLISPMIEGVDILFDTGFYTNVCVEGTNQRELQDVQSQFHIG
ncbi:2Fe-2S iron-sulfur cluster-binding protein [Helicobacter sp. MIT 14-3879]|uniref:2Fe-2S iron-sulfur cluster-binding protein n=1 Tax=Helicobacter sp. MIT 14-3879 TaxID=2040649 RepID=UPI000E1F082F|nr:2Fe-2S iron-sulfur cluster-binding protein [Helicobacter sp. MIT 14-3879]RDU59586.1 donor-ubiquinone reductase [Helicobacter sp. MIT 14-3879]